MNKKTGYRRFDIFLADLKIVGVEAHYVVILSNWKNNIKASSVNCCMVTSKIKEHPSHVSFEGFGLPEKSQVKCERILTLEKKDLIKKVGNIDNIEVQIQIEKCLKLQLQLDSKYNNFDALDLENLFIDNSKIDNDKVELEKLKTQLYNAYQKRELKEAIILACSLRELAINSKCQDAKDYIQYSLYIKSSCNLGLNNLDSAQAGVRECLTYINNPSSYNRQYSLSIWLAGNIAEKMGDLDKASTIYTSLVKYYKMNYESLMRITCLFNLAFIKKDVKAMNNIYRILEKTECTNTSIYNKECYKQELLRDMKNELSAF